MMPYIYFPSFTIGPVTIQVWGLMVATGIVAAVLLMNFLAKKYFLSAEVISDMAIWTLISAFVFARLFHVVFYSLDFYLAHPIDIFKIWHGGASSLGGFFGAGVALWLFAKKRKFSLSELLPYFDIAALSLWLGWGIGRIGCFLIHDHPGTLSHFLLAVKYPDGPRHDLGLYESILGFCLFVVFALFFKKLTSRQWGLVTVYSSMSYAVARFFLDFLRASDVPGSDARYASLTPAQWGMAVFVFALTSLMIFGKVKRQSKGA